MSKNYFNSLHGVVISQHLADFSYNKRVTDNLALPLWNNLPKMIKISNKLKLFAFHDPFFC